MNEGGRTVLLSSSVMGHLSAWDSIKGTLRDGSFTAKPEI